MIRILNAEPVNYNPQARAVLASIGEVVERPLSQHELPAWVPEFDVLMVRLGLAVTREVLEAGRRLRAVVTATTGVDHIDTEFAQANGVAVLSLKGETEFLETIPSTAEHTWALLLAVARRLPQAVEAVRAGSWNRDEWRGRELAGKRLSIVGLGRIGEQVARYGLAFGMRVGATDPYRTGWPAEVERFSVLDELLRRSDILSLHVPLTAETVQIIGDRELALLPAGAIVINTARGGVLQEVALVAALARDHLAGAAIDVLEGEQDPDRRRSSPLLDYARAHPNLLITPHLGGATVEAMERTELFMARKLRTWYEAQTSRASAH